jgi:hypothetical protein
MHSAKTYCGDLSNSAPIRIPDIMVSLTSHSVVNDHKNDINSDMINFRYMVDKFINDHLKKSGCEFEFIQLAVDLISYFLIVFNSAN